MTRLTSQLEIASKEYVGKIKYNGENNKFDRLLIDFLVSSNKNEDDFQKLIQNAKYLGLNCYQMVALILLTENRHYFDDKVESVKEFSDEDFFDARELYEKLFEYSYEENVIEKAHIKQPEINDIVFFLGSAHVCLYLGKNKDGKDEVLSLWTGPDNKNTLQKTTIDKLDEYIYNDPRLIQSAIELIHTGLSSESEEEYSSIEETLEIYGCAINDIVQGDVYSDDPDITLDLIVAFLKENFPLFVKKVVAPTHDVDVSKEGGMKPGLVK